MICLLPPSCPCSCPQPPWLPPPSFGRPWQFGNLAKLVVDIHQFRANHSNRFLGILRDTPLQYNTVYCLVSCDIFYIMLHKQNSLFFFNLIQRKWTFASCSYLRITFLDFVPCTFSTFSKKRSPWNNGFFSSWLSTGYWGQSSSQWSLQPIFPKLVEVDLCQQSSQYQL